MQYTTRKPKAMFVGIDPLLMGPRKIKRHQANKECMYVNGKCFNCGNTNPQTIRKNNLSTNFIKGVKKHV